MEVNIMEATMEVAVLDTIQVITNKQHLKMGTIWLHDGFLRIFTLDFLLFLALLEALFLRSQFSNPKGQSFTLTLTNLT